MKLIFTLLISIFTCSLFASLNPQKVGEAVAYARVHKSKKTFYCEAVPETSTLANPHYHLILKGVKPEQKFKLYQFSLHGIHHPALVADGIVNANGQPMLTLSDQTVKLSSYHFTAGSVVPGEPLYSLVVIDEKEYVAASIIPKPVEIKGQDNRLVAMELVSAKHPKILVRGENFKPNEEINITINSSTKKETKTVTASPRGTFHYIMESNLKQLENGRVQITTSEQTRPLSLGYNWNFLVDIAKRKVR